MCLSASSRHISLIKAFWLIECGLMQEGSKEAVRPSILNYNNVVSGFLW